MRRIKESLDDYKKFHPEKKSGLPSKNGFYMQGYDACISDDDRLAESPYEHNTRQDIAWSRGWNQAAIDTERPDKLKPKYWMHENKASLKEYSGSYTPNLISQSEVPAAPKYRSTIATKDTPIYRNSVIRKVGPKEAWNYEQDIGDLKAAIKKFQDKTAEMPDDYIELLCKSDYYPLDDVIDDDQNLNMWCKDAEEYINGTLNSCI